MSLEAQIQELESRQETIEKLLIKIVNHLDRSNQITEKFLDQQMKIHEHLISLVPRFEQLELLIRNDHTTH